MTGSNGVESWRLIPVAAAPGDWNMAVDEAMLEAHLRGLVPPTLRLYLWEPAAVSIGYTQALPAGLKERALERGLDVVRRPTGGRAVLHLDDLTYSFVGTSAGAGAPLPAALSRPRPVPPGRAAAGAGEAAIGSTERQGFLRNSISGAYEQICLGLRLAMSSLGLELESGSAGVPYRDAHDCFRATTGSDLHCRGAKMIGSAQLRRKGAVLQHGSILLKQDQGMMPLLLGSAWEGPAPSRHANLFDVLGREVPLADLQEALKRGFEKAFGISLVEGGLSETELLLAGELRSRYRQLP